MILNNKFLIISIIFFLHLAFLFFPSVNFEHSFFQAANNFELNKIDAMNNYFAVQANTFVYPILIFLFKNLFFLDYPYAARLISSIGILSLGLGIIKLSKSFSLFNNNYLLIIILLNPFIWVMAHRGTPDFISSSLSLMSLSYLIARNNLFIQIFFSLILGLAIAIKPTVGIILIFINFYYFYFYDYKFILFIKSIFFINFLSIFPFLLYFILIKFNFNFYLTNDYFLNSLKISSIFNYINNLIIYVGYFYLFIIPLRINTFWNNLQINKFNYFYPIIFLILSYFGYNLIIPQLELNLSFISIILGRKIENTLYLFSFFLFLYDIYFNKSVFFKNNILNKSLILTIFTFFITMSFFSPSQRYLICPIVLFTYLIFSQCNNNFILTLIIYIFFSLILSINHYLNGKISQLIFDDMTNINIINNSCPGVIEAHIGDKFPISNKNCFNDYSVIYGYDKNSELYRELNFLFFSKKLSVIKVR